MMTDDELYRELAARHTDGNGVLMVDSLVKGMNANLGMALNPPKQMLLTISRSGGYTIESAACEFSDNVLTPEVGATFFEVTFTQTGRKLTGIYFADNGKSMDRKRTIVFWTLADAAHYFDSSSMSKYGIGAKGGGYFFGNTITLYTKVDGVITKSKQTFDTYPMINWCESQEDRITQEEINMVNKKLHNSEHGTVICITDLTNEDWSIDDRDVSKTIVSNRIKNGYKEYYCENEFIKSGTKRIIVGGEVIKPKSLFGIGGSTILNGEDIMEKNLIDEREIHVDGCSTIKYISVHKSRCYIGPKKGDPKYDFNLPGVYIVRNGRLLTSRPIMDSDIMGKKVGCIKHKQFCAVLYTTGEHDELFKLTYNKVLTSLRELKKDVKDKLIKYVDKDLNESEARYMKEGQGDVDDDTKKADAEANTILGKLLKGFKKTGVYKKKTKDPEPKPNDPKPKDDDPKPKDDDPKPKDEKKKGEFDIGLIKTIHGGEREQFLSIEMGENLCHWIVYINMDHPSFDEIGLDNNPKARAAIAYLMITSHLSLRKKYEETCEEDYFMMENILTRIEETRESFIRDMIDKTIVLREPTSKVSNFSVRELENCEGVGISYEELLKDKLEKEMSEASAN